MSIQFLCPGCRQPIEVDQEHAGRMAACPYCRQVVAVPQESTYRPEAVAPARPAGLGQGPGAEGPAWSAASAGLHVGAPPIPRGAAVARRYGNYALLCAALVVLLVGVLMVQILGRAVKKLELDTATQTTMPQLARDEVNQATTEAIKELVGEPWFVGFFVGSALVGVVGVALAITSLAQRGGGKWRGILSLIICGLWILFVCAGSLRR